MSSNINNLTKKYMKNNQKGFIVPMLIAIITILAIGGVVYIYQNKKVEAPSLVDNTETQQSNQIQQQTNTQTPPSVNTQANNSITQTFDWKTYTNTKYGFEIKYPENMAINFEEVSGIGFWNFNIYDKKQAEREDMVENEIIPEFIMTNRNAEDSTFKIKNKFDSDDTGIIFQVGEKKLTAVCNGSNALKTDLINSLLLCNQILSTFKFTK